MQVDRPVITTVIPTYRRPKLLRRAIMSVLNQSYRHFQVCVYDNASGDETADMVAEIASADSRVKYYQHPTNIGAAANFNFGISQVKTPFFSVLSDDDVVLPDFYAEMLEAFERYPEAKFSAGSVINMTETGKVLSAVFTSWRNEGCYLPPDGLYAMLGGKHPITTAILFRKEIIDIYQRFDPDIVISDLDLEVRIAARFPFVISKKPCGIFVAHPASAGVQANSSWIWPSCQKLIENLERDGSIPLDIRINAKRLLNQYFKSTIFVLGLRSAIRGDFADVHQAADALDKHYGERGKASVLKILSQIFEHVGVIHTFARLIYNIRDTIYGIKNAKLQKEYAHLARFLDI